MIVLALVAALAAGPFDGPPGPPQVETAEVVDNPVLRGGLAFGAGVVVGYGVGLADFAAAAFVVCSFSPLGFTQALVAVAAAVALVALVEVGAHGANGGDLSDVALHVGIIAAASSVGLALGAIRPVFVDRSLDALALPFVGAGLGAGVAQAVLLFIDLSAPTPPPRPTAPQTEKKPTPQNAQPKQKNEPPTEAPSWMTRSSACG